MRSPDPLARIDALAVDYDRTLTDAALRPHPRALAALRQARSRGRRVIVVSGRDLDFLQRELDGCADAIVAENGCVLLDPVRGPRRLAQGHERIHEVLDALPFDFERATILRSASLEHESALRAAFEAAGVEAALIRNRDRVMVAPMGVDKAAGVLAALELLGIAPERAAAAGDGENDLVMLRAVGYGVAVENAVPELKAEADHVTQGFGGEGLARWIEESWLASEVAA